jgi:chemotaxis protein methyltransferase CheR
MNITDFRFVADLLYRSSGLVLGEEKAYLLESRLNPVARKYEFESFDALVAALRRKTSNDLEFDVVEAMTTNESFFFRDQKPFDQFRDLVLPALLENRSTRRRIRIWCAACAAGQEPYSLAMLLKEAGPRLSGWTVEILATDISKQILQKASAGQYTQFEVQRGLPINYLVKYFKKAEDKWQITNDIRQMVTFKSFNLLGSFAGLGTFDVVFCRNVLIYFDQQTKSRVLSNIAKIMSADAFLYLGGAETVIGVSEEFKLLPGHRGIYGLAPAGGVSKGYGPGPSIGMAS